MLNRDDAHVEVPTRIERLAGESPLRFRISPAPGRDRGALVGPAIIGSIAMTMGLISDDPWLQLGRRYFGVWFANHQRLDSALEFALAVLGLTWSLWTAARVLFQTVEIAIWPDAIEVTTRLPLLPARVRRLPREAGARARWLPGAFGLPPRIDLGFKSGQPLKRVEEHEARALVDALRTTLSGKAEHAALPPPPSATK